MKFWKEASEAKGRKLENYTRLKGCVISPWHFKGWGNKRSENGDGKKLLTFLEKGERIKIAWAVQVNSFRGLFGERRKDTIQNPRVIDLCVMQKRMGMIHESVFCWFGHMERTEPSRIAKIIYI